MDAATQQKLARLERARKRIEEFVEQGGDIKSDEAAPLGMELVLAANEVGKTLGYEILKPIEKK
jgi:hypothetical protein